MTRIGVVSTFTSGVYLSTVFSQLIRLAPDHDATLVILRTGDQLPDWDSPLAVDLCDGWIVLGDTSAHGFRAQLQALGRPVCALAHDAADGRCSAVQSDNGAGMTLALESLLAQGHREFVFIGRLESQDIRERAEAFQAFLIERGLPHGPERVHNCQDYSILGGLEGTREVVELGVPFTALLGGNDQAAVGAQRYFQRVTAEGVTCPAIFGYDNSSLAQDPANRLSSVDQNFEALCHAALEEVCRLVRDPSEPRTIRVAPTLALRESSHAGAVPDVHLNTGRSPQSNLLFRDEMNRVLHGKNSSQNLDSLLTRLGEPGRSLLFAQVQEQTFHVTFSLRTPSNRLPASGNIRSFGRELVEGASAAPVTVFLIPIFSASQMVSVLGLAIPSQTLSSHDSYAEALQELNLTNFTVELAVMRSHLEGIVEQRTRELRAAQEELVRTTQVAVLGPIVHGISHHLSTPLGNALLAITALSDTSSDPLIELISRNLDRAAKLVRQFQTVTDIQLQEEPTSFEPDAVVQLAVEYTQAMFPRVSFAFSRGAAGCCLLGPARAFSAAVEAILENAVVHGYQGTGSGTVEITTSCDGNELDLQIRDFGAGMASLAAARVFDPFYTSDFAKSNGLGLTLVQNVVTARFRGKVEVETSVNNGFLVRCRLPLLQQIT